MYPHLSAFWYVHVDYDRFHGVADKLCQQNSANIPRFYNQSFLKIFMQKILFYVMKSEVQFQIPVLWNASKEIYHFFRATLTEIHCIKINYTWTVDIDKL